MAKARNTTNVRTRAIKAYLSAFGLTAIKDGSLKLTVYKSRSKNIITVVSEHWGQASWSYKGGSLRRISA